MQALTHRSWCAEHDGRESNERLEFLGDAVLGLVVTEHIHARFPDFSEGDLAKLRASLVNANVLAEVATEIGLGDHLFLGRGEAASGGGEKPSILADALEAVIGAVYVDGGMEVARTLVLSLLGGRIDPAAIGPGGFDAKTRLQELAARLEVPPVRYEIDESGPDHAKWFEARVLLDGTLVGEGEGRSKKQAEQAAAQDAHERLGDEPSDRSAESHHSRRGTSH
ncbi:MAG: ribonuclease III [Actinomycetota bacterium]